MVTRECPKCRKHWSSSVSSEVWICDDCGTPILEEHTINQTIRPIPNWSERKLVCQKCGEKRSVKYFAGGVALCNRCAFLSGRR